MSKGHCTKVAELRASLQAAASRRGTQSPQSAAILSRSPAFRDLVAKLARNTPLQIADS